MSVENEQKSTQEIILLDLDVNKDATEYFTKNATYDQHYDAQEANRDKYVATLMAFEEYSIEVLANARSKSLAAALARRDKDLIKYLLDHNKNFAFTDVLKAVTLLDSNREIKAIEKKIARVAKTGSVIKAKKLGVLKNEIKNFELLKPKVGSFSGALAKLIKKWVRKYSEKDLEYFALSLPTEPWKKLANLCHFNPTLDFPNAPWFLPFCFGKEPVKDSLLDKCRQITNENANELVEMFDLPFSFVKNYSKNLNEKSKKKFAESEKFDTIIWYYEDLSCPDVDIIIRARLERGERIELGYGKLMERLLMFKELNEKTNASLKHNSLYSLFIPNAETELKKFKANLASPVAILGDASSSMSVAIRTATIIGSLLAAICSAKLTFFNQQNFEAKLNPKNVSDVLNVAYETKATGSTSPAASLVPYYDNKEIIKTFIIVTDEEENTDGVTSDGKRWRFFDLFMAYREKVYPASLIFVSFLDSQHSVGQMYKEFLNSKVPDVSQYKFSRSKPDLTKLDSILGRICSKSSQSFAGRVEKLESDIKTKGLIDTFENIKLTTSLLNEEDKPKPVVF